MAIDLYKGFTNYITGESFKCISYTREAFRFEWVVKAGGYIPFEHIHLNQDEIFHVQKGELRMSIDGKEVIARQGQTVSVPKGAAHIAYNNNGEELICTVEYVPALDNYKFFQCFGGLTIDNDMDDKGSIHIGKMLFFSKKMNAKCITRPTSIPRPLFYVAMNLLFIVGLFAGWTKQYKRYTGS